MLWKYAIYIFDANFLSKMRNIIHLLTLHWLFIPYTSTVFWLWFTDYMRYSASRHRIQSVHIQRMQRIWNLDTEATRTETVQLYKRWWIWSFRKINFLSISQTSVADLWTLDIWPAYFWLTVFFFSLITWLTELIRPQYLTKYNNSRSLKKFLSGCLYCLAWRFRNKTAKAVMTSDKNVTNSSRISSDSQKEARFGIAMGSAYLRTIMTIFCYTSILTGFIYSLNEPYMMFGLRDPDYIWLID